MWPVPSQAQDQGHPQAPCSPRGRGGAAEGSHQGCGILGPDLVLARLSCQGRLGVRAGSPSRFELSPVEGPGDQSFAGHITAELAGRRRRLAFRRLRRRLLHNVWK